MSNLVSSFNVDSMIARNVGDYHYPHYPAADYLFTRQSLMFLCARAHSCLFFGGPQREVKCKGKEERCAWRASCTSSWEETQTGMYSSIFFEEKGLAGWLAGYVTRRIPRVAFFWHVQTYLIPILSR